MSILLIGVKFKFQNLASLLLTPLIIIQTWISRRCKWLTITQKQSCRQTWRFLQRKWRLSISCGAVRFFYSSDHYRILILCVFLPFFHQINAKQSSWPTQDRATSGLNTQTQPVKIPQRNLVTFGQIPSSLRKANSFWCLTRRVTHSTVHFQIVCSQSQLHSSIMANWSGSLELTLTLTLSSKTW